MRKDTVEVRLDTVEVRLDAVEVRLDAVEVLDDSDSSDSGERPCTCGSGVHWAWCPENSPYCG